MRLAEIADRLQVTLPERTDLFSRTLPIIQITSDGAVATVATDGVHGIRTGDMVSLSGVETRTPIVSVSKDGFLYTFTTSADHDLTEGNPDTATVPLLGFTDAAWNASLTLTKVANRRTFTVQSAATIPTLNGGEVLLEPNRLDGVNGLFLATATNRTVFTVSGVFPSGLLTPVAGKVSTSPRVGVAVDVERAAQIYDEYPQEFWAFVVPLDATVSKDRNTDSDATAAQTSGTSRRLRILDQFAVFVFAPVSDQLAAEEALDICRHDLLGAIFGSLFGYKPTSGLSCPSSEFEIIPTGHQAFDYNKATLVYMYEFQAPVDLSTGDATQTFGSRAFRDADYAQTNLHEPATVGINLDDQPL